MTYTITVSNSLLCLDPAAVFLDFQELVVLYRFHLQQWLYFPLPSMPRDLPFNHPLAM